MRTPERSERGKMSKPKLSGMHLFFDSNYIKVKRKKISADKIRPQPAIRYGVKEEDQVKLVKSATTPRFKENITTNIVNRFKREEVLDTVKSWIKTDEEGKDHLGDLLMLAFAAAQEEALDGYSRVYVDVEGNIQEGSEVKKFQVVEVKEDGTEVLDEFPYTNATQIFTINEATVQPRIYWDEMLQAGDMIYEVYATDDVGRFQLWKVANTLNNWPKDPSDPESPTEEMMAVIQPVYLTSGTTQEYIVLISPKRIIEEDGSEKFVLVMKCCQSNVAYLNAMKRPAADEVPVTIQAEQKPLRLVSFADMVKAMQK